MTERGRPDGANAEAVRDRWEAELALESLDTSQPSEEARLARLMQNAPIPIISSPPERTWIWSDLQLAEPRRNIKEMNRHLLREWSRRVHADNVGPPTDRCCSSRLARPPAAPPSAFAGSSPAPGRSAPRSAKPAGARETPSPSAAAAGCSPGPRSGGSAKTGSGQVWIGVRYFFATLAPTPQGRVGCMSDQATARRDTNQIVHAAVQSIIARTEPPAPVKNLAAVALGKLGGLKGGKAGRKRAPRSSPRNGGRRSPRRPPAHGGSGRETRDRGCHERGTP